MEETPFPIATSNEELLSNIKKFSESDYKKKSDEYYKRIGTYEDGNSCEKLYSYLKEKGFE